jgi:hypothetical protein
LKLTTIWNVRLITYHSQQRQARSANDESFTSCKFSIANRATWVQTNNMKLFPDVKLFTISLLSGAFATFAITLKYFKIEILWDEKRCIEYFL